MSKIRVTTGVRPQVTITIEEDPFALGYPHGAYEAILTPAGHSTGIVLAHSSTPGGVQDAVALTVAVLRSLADQLEAQS